MITNIRYICYTYKLLSKYMYFCNQETNNKTPAPISTWPLEGLCGLEVHKENSVLLDITT